MAALPPPWFPWRNWDSVSGNMGTSMGKVAKKAVSPKRPRSGTTLYVVEPKVRGTIATDRLEHEQLAYLIAAFGNNGAASLLDVDPSQLSRVARKKEAISLTLSRRIADLSYVLARASKVLHADEIGPWLRSPEPLLGGGVPLNVLRLHGAGRVVDSLDAREAGAFA